MAAQSKEWVWSHSFAGNAGSNPAKGHRCGSCALSDKRSLQGAEHYSEGVLWSVVYITECDRTSTMRRLWRTRAAKPWETKYENENRTHQEKCFNFFFKSGHASHALGNVVCCCSTFARSNLKACICLMNMHSACSFICSSVMFSIYLHFPWNNILCVCRIDITCTKNWSLFLIRHRPVVSQSDVDISDSQWIFIY